MRSWALGASTAKNNGVAPRVRPMGISSIRGGGELNKRVSEQNSSRQVHVVVHFCTCVDTPRARPDQVLRSLPCLAFRPPPPDDLSRHGVGHDPRPPGRHRHPRRAACLQQAPNGGVRVRGLRRALPGGGVAHGRPQARMPGGASKYVPTWADTTCAAPFALTPCALTLAPTTCSALGLRSNCVAERQRASDARTD